MFIGLFSLSFFSLSSTTSWCLSVSTATLISVHIVLYLVHFVLPFAVAVKFAIIIIIIIIIMLAHLGFWIRLMIIGSNFIKNNNNNSLACPSCLSGLFGTISPFSRVNSGLFPWSYFSFARLVLYCCFG